MKLTMEEIQSIAKLSRIILNKKEQQDMVKDLSDFISYADSLAELDLEDIKILSHVIPDFNALREDEVKPSMICEQLMKNAPDKAEGTFIVPKVIE